MTETIVGRPRDDGLTEKALNATYQLLTERPYSEISLVKIAETAGVSRKALYSRWNSKSELIIEAFNLFNPPKMPQLENNIRTQLIDYIEQSLVVIVQNFALFREVLADIQHQPKTLIFFEENFSLPRQTIYCQILQKGVERGEFSVYPNIPLAVEALSAIFRQRILLNKEINREFIESVVDLLIR
ncbi:TetR/AcrR family transcriptional regulator [Mannheimia varigena]|uniref:TetR/AcrR family transcriptional regulator n=1 Tax=Mannheimia varigena TaxID=85404 RepID=UPI0015B4F6AF|nr:TetR/AcrR family transcriptional regulator [Mannheimia varigena]QLD32303.1 TetR/AcrR family transcriptional regulator [Mannheimia varigena]